MAHTWPEGHSIPQAPQWPRSFCVSRQVPEQLVKPVAQVTAHAPDEHTWPEGH
jgi:hypothetical protein